MAGVRAPKQWSLTKQETITSFEAWRQNLQYTLSLDPNFAGFLVDGFTWLKKTNNVPLRGLVNDAHPIPEANRRTAAQKTTHLELMLGQIANYCPVISRNTIVKNSTSVTCIWQSIRLHYGFQSTGAHFLDFNSIHLEPNERAEDLYQRLMSFVEDNLLHAGGTIQHHGAVPDADEELSPSLENFVVLSWLRLVHKDLPNLVKQRYGAELRSQTLASLKPEISQALDSLLDEIHSAADAKVLRTAFQSQTRGRSRTFEQKPRSFEQKTVTQQRQSKTCVLCQQAGRAFDHFLSKCRFLPESDRLYLSKVRQSAICEDTACCGTDDEGDYSTEPDSDDTHNRRVNVIGKSRRVVTKQSPHFKAFFKHHPLQLTVDTGAEVNMIKASTAEYIGAVVKKSSQRALQADGVTPLGIVGETRLTLRRGQANLDLEALVVSDLDVDILAGIPFMSSNDISVRPAKQQIIISDSDTIYYGQTEPISPHSRVRRTQAFVLRAKPVSTTVWPGCYVELDTPPDISPDCLLAVEPHSDRHNQNQEWPRPHITDNVGGKIRIVNNTSEPQSLRRNEHLCQVRVTCVPSSDASDNFPVKPTVVKSDRLPGSNSSLVKLDPDNILSVETRSRFESLLLQYDNVFSNDIKGYNGAVGPFEACVNMGPTQPPQRKGRVPQYARDKLVELQNKFDELESQGVFRRPEDIGVNVEYLNPSFLVKKSSGGFRLVTAFADVGRYCKPQPSLMPDVDSTLRTIAQWKYIIATDLTSAFYQIPLSRSSLKYCGIATPFRGVRVYTRCAMGMPGSETALEELMCRVLGDCVQDGIVAKLADDLYCGGNSPEELLINWERVLQALQKCNLSLAPTKTLICPRSTTILGWIWSQGSISASSHRVATLSSCPLPETVRGLRAFIGAYKMLSRVLPHCSQLLAPLENAIAGLLSSDKIVWSDDTIGHFNEAQKSLGSHKSITLPRSTDQLWIVTDGSVNRRGIGATLYVGRNSKILLAGFFSAKLRKHQVTWLPCEIEALSIAAAIKHFSPHVIQSSQTACVLTDSKPCVQGFEKLCRGEFSASPRVTSFLSMVSRYQLNVRHLAGSTNIPSDFASRNASECCEPRCQICCFIARTEDSVVRSVNIQDLLGSHLKLPFTTRSAWIDVQSECPDLRRTHAHLKQGTRPSKKLTNIRDVKRYLGVVSIAKDGLLIVRRCDPLLPPAELIVVPRSVLDGLVTALHIKLDHPSKHQLLLVLKRHFYALDLVKSVSDMTDSCHTCAALKRFPDTLIKQSSEDPPEAVGLSFAADVLKRSRQLILVVRETVTSTTMACFIEDEKRNTLRDGLAQLLVDVHPLDGPNTVVRVDPAPGFVALRNDDTLDHLNISIEIGRVKNVNKNPVAEKAIAELEDELLRQEPGGGPVSHLKLAVAVARLNSRIRNRGLSSREMWTQRSQYTLDQLPISDRDLISEQHAIRSKNHEYSERSKCSRTPRDSNKITVGDLVYLYADKDKSRARNRYLVVSSDGEWCFIKKFTGNQLRASSYKVKCTECYLVESDFSHSLPRSSNSIDSDDEEEGYFQPRDTNPPVPAEIPPVLISVPDDIHEVAADHDTNQPSASEPAVHVPSTLPQANRDVSSPPVHGSGEHARPKRARKLPKYLEDYVT